MVALRLDKEEIINGLKMGIYTKEYRHVNPYPDPNDPDDPSVNEHTIYIYINENFDVVGVKSFFGESPTTGEIGAEMIESGAEVRIPVIVKDIPQMAVQLGMITRDEFIVLKVCDGMNTIETVAQIVQKPIEEIEKMMANLRKKGLVQVIRRT